MVNLPVQPVPEAATLVTTIPIVQEVVSLVETTITVHGVAKGHQAAVHLEQVVVIPLPEVRLLHPHRAVPAAVVLQVAVATNSMPFSGTKSVI
jgi:hypothetical protein